MPKARPFARRVDGAIVAALLLGLLLPAAPMLVSPVVAQDENHNEVCSSAWLARLRPLRQQPPNLAASLAGLYPAGLRGIGIQDGSGEPLPDIISPGPIIDRSSLDLNFSTSHAVTNNPTAVDEIMVATRPNDPYFSTGQTSNLRATLSAEDAWRVSFGSEEITIAVISDGVDMEHPDLRAKIWRNEKEIGGNGLDDDGNGYVDDVVGWDFGENNSDPSPISIGRRRLVSFANRGTMMAGIAAAETHNGYGIAGVSWGARIMPLKINFLWRGTYQGEEVELIASYTRNAIEAVCYAADNGARVILLGGWLITDPIQEEERFEPMSSLQAAIGYATNQRGAVVIAPAGDCGVLHENNRIGCPDPARYGDAPTILPAAMERVIAVSSVGSDRSQREDASSGEWVDIAAPGQGFYTTVNTENFDDIHYVTSRHPQPSDFAAAHVAGAAALLWSVNPHLSPLQVEVQLCNSARRDVGGPFTGMPMRNDAYGCGVLNLENMVKQTPWRVHLSTPVLKHFVDRAEVRPVTRVGNLRLNEGFWEVRPDVPWIEDSHIAQRIGEPSQLELAVNLDALRGISGGLAEGDRFATILRACPVNQLNIMRDDERDCRPYSPSGCFCVNYELLVLDGVPRVYLPFTTR